VSRTNNPTTHRLMLANAQAAAEAMKAKEWTDDESDARSERSKRLNLARHLRTGYRGPRWTPEQLALLGTLLDDDVARQTGRTTNAVRIKREKLGIPNPKDLEHWTAEEVAQLGTAIDAAVARRIGRTPSAVAQKRIALRIPPAQ
jgi:hypothetical protein